MSRISAADRVAEEVRAMAARKRYSQTRVSQVLGCSQAAVSRLFRGEVPFDVVELDTLAREWDVPITTFLGWSSEGDEKADYRRDIRDYAGGIPSQGEAFLADVA